MTEESTSMENPDLPIGTLFNSINFYKIEDLDKFLREMNSEQALYCLIEAAQSAYKRNVFTLLESELLSKSIRKLTLPEKSEE